MTTKVVSVTSIGFPSELIPTSENCTCSASVKFSDNVENLRISPSLRELEPTNEKILNIKNINGVIFCQFNYC